MFTFGLTCFACEYKNICSIIICSTLCLLSFFLCSSGFFCVSAEEDRKKIYRKEKTLIFKTRRIRLDFLACICSILSHVNMKEGKKIREIDDFVIAKYEWKYNAIRNENI